MRGKTPLLVALALAVLAFIVAYSAVEKRRADAIKGWNLVPVIVASVDISEGTEVTMEMVSQRSIPEQFVTSSVVKPDSASYVIGQKTVVPLQAGDPLLWSQFETTRASERLSTKVMKRARAITIDAKTTAAVGGWIRPNDHIDLLGTFKEPSTGEQVAVTLMQNLIVIATGRISGTTNVNLLPEAERSYNTVTLMVIPEEAEMLALAQELGTLTMTLRNESDLDDGVTRQGKTTIATLLNGERLTLIEKERRERITVIRGKTSSQGEGP